MTDAQKEDFFVTDLDASGGLESPIQTADGAQAARR